MVKSVCSTNVRGYICSPSTYSKASHGRFSNPGLQGMEAETERSLGLASCQPSSCGKPCLKKTKWNVVEQDTQHLPQASVYMQGLKTCTYMHIYPHHAHTMHMQTHAHTELTSTIHMFYFVFRGAKLVVRETAQLRTTQALLSAEPH